MEDCENCKHLDKLDSEKPCNTCWQFDNFEAAEKDTNRTVTLEEFIKGISMNLTKPAKPLLTKNEYLALELTKIYVMQCCGQAKGGLMKMTIAESYDHFLDHFNKKNEEET